MRSLVVLCAAFAVCVAAPSDEGVAKKRSIGYVAYGPPAAVYEPVVETQAVYAAPSIYAAPAAVSHQSRVDVKSTPAVVATAPIVAARTVVEPVSTFVSTPVVASQVVPAAVSHQSRVDVRTSPAVVAAAPAVVAARTVYSAPAIVETPSVYYASAPAATIYAGGAAVSHQSRVDVKSSPAVITQQVVEPSYGYIASAPFVAAGPAVVDARSVYSPSVYSLWK